jgi:hypothetical protein
MFRREFQKRKTRLEYLRAYKQLHDTLRNIYDNRVTIANAVAGLGRRSTAARPGTVADLLSRWLAMADRAAACIGKRAPGWLDEFRRKAEAVVDALTSPKATKERRETAARAAEYLDSLPAQQQVNLNEALLGQALELNTDELIGLMDEFQGQLTGSRADHLRRRVDAFRGQCQQLQDRIDDHRGCQWVAIALQSALGAGRSGAAPAEWAGVCARLDQLATSRPGNLDACRAAESAHAYTPAAAKGALDEFRERFDKLFLETDKALLEQIKDLVAATASLDDSLELYLP